MTAWCALALSLAILLGARPVRSQESLPDEPSSPRDAEREAPAESTSGIEEAGDTPAAKEPDPLPDPASNPDGGAPTAEFELLPPDEGSTPESEDAASETPETRSASGDAALPPKEPGAVSPTAAPRADVAPEGGAGADVRQDDEGMKLTLGADLETFVGQGTFVADSGARNPYFAWLLTLRPMLMPTKSTRVFVVQSLSQELSNTDSDIRNYRVLLTDTLLGGRVTYYTWPLTKTSFDAGLIAQFPTSISSRYETLVFALRPGLGLVQPMVPGLTLLFRTEFRKNFHAYTSPVASADDVGDHVFLARQGGNELLGTSRVSPGGNNVSYEFWNRVLVSYAFLEHWAFQGLLLVVNGFTYENYPLDELSGVGAKAGRGRRDQALAELSVGRNWNDRYTLSGGVITQGSLTPADGRGVRFPFFDFTSASRNLTSFFVRFSIDFGVLGAPQKLATTPNLATGARAAKAF